MRRLSLVLLALAGVFAALLAVPATSAEAGADAPAAATADDAVRLAKSAGQRYALRSAANGRYVTVEANDTGAVAGRLRARADQVGSWERLTVHTNHAGATVGLRSEVTGLFATAEVNYTGDLAGLLRARGEVIGSWEQFEVVPSTGGTFALRSVANGRYVTAEIDDAGAGAGQLRARATTVGSWERFTLVPQGTTGGGAMPAAGPATATTVKAVTWNVCANNNSGCGFYLADGAELAAGIRARLGQPGSGALPDVVLLQEVCEKQTGPVELALEQATGRGWDVRFAPISYELGAVGTTVLPGVRAQKQCALSGGVDRGAYGVALAVPDENTWYLAKPLDSPATYVNGQGVTVRAEQRTALCAVLPARAVQACTAHFSVGRGGEDPTGTYRARQAAQVLQAVGAGRTAGYRTVFGGDLNVVPPAENVPADQPGGPSTVLTDTYAAHRECAQLTDPAAPRTGPVTGVGASPTMKLDYLFAPASFTRCAVSSTAGSSDHRTVYGTVPLPAGG